MEASLPKWVAVLADGAVVCEGQASFTELAERGPGAIESVLLKYAGGRVVTAVRIPADAVPEVVTRTEVHYRQGVDGAIRERTVLVGWRVPGDESRQLWLEVLEDGAVVAHAEPARPWPVEMAR